MERIDVDGDQRLAALVEAASRGEEALLTRDGTVVASVVPEPTTPRTRTGQDPRGGIDLAALEALHSKLPPALRGANTAALIREMRDMDDH